MIKLSNFYMPNSNMLKFSDNPDSEDITERSYPEDSDNCIKASTRFQGMPIEIS